MHVDVERWPALTSFPSGPRARVSAAIARQLFRATTRRLGVVVRELGPEAPLAEPVAAAAGAKPHPVIELRRPEEFYARLGSDGLIGLGEAYMSGAWQSPDVGGALTVLAREMPRLVPQWMQALRRLYVRRVPDRSRGTTTQTRANISHHYDLSNDLFALFLDPTMTYSAAMFETDQPEGVRGQDELHRRLPGPEPTSQRDLYAGQVRKIDRLLDRIGVRSDTQLLEIGTGWGELAIRAAQRGARVHSITLSSEQRDFALRRAQEVGVADRISIDLRDYRQVERPDQHGGRGYDAVASVEMIEAVGHEFWPVYFRTIDQVLEPGGAAGIQAITMPHDRMLATRNTYTFILKYIFPGGFLPSVEVVDQVTRSDTSLRVSERLSFGAHYADTLRQWDERFLAHRHDWLALGFDEVFGRMWHFYLEYSRAGFNSGYIDVQQIVLRKAA